MRTSTLFFAIGTVFTMVGCSSTPYNPNYPQTTQYKGSQPYSTASQSPIAQPVSTTIETQAAVPVSYQTQAANYTYTQVSTDCLNSTNSDTQLNNARFNAVDGTINCDPVGLSGPQTAAITPAYDGSNHLQARYDKEVPIPVSTTSVYADAPTTAGIEENVQSFGDAGTPGYYAVNGQQDSVAMAAPVYAPMPAPATNPQPTATLPYQPLVPAKPSPQPAHTIQSHFNGTDTYTIQPGNTVYSLAREACVSVSELKDANGINEDFYIRAGDQIKIPSNRCPSK